MKTFKVASVSSNTNSFGLYGMILVAKDGEAWEVAANNINVKDKGSFITGIEGYGFEIPRRLLKCPKNVVKEIWQ